MEEPPFQFRLRTIFLLTFVVAVLCFAIPVLYSGMVSFREFSRKYWWMLLIFGTLMAYHVLRVIVAWRRFRDSDL
jgi:hypothetical protein